MDKHQGSIAVYLPVFIILLIPGDISKVRSCIFVSGLLRATYFANLVISTCLSAWELPSSRFGCSFQSLHCNRILLILKVV